MFSKDKKHISVGEKIVVSAIRNHTALVKEVKYDPSISATRIVLDFGKFGQSKVYDYDEGKVWFRISKLKLR